MKVLVTPRSLTRARHPAVDLIREAGYEVIMGTPGAQPTEGELLEIIPDCVGYLAGVEPVSARVLSVARNLVAISRNGVGTDNIDLDAASASGIAILTTPGANSQGVAELTIGLILGLARRLPRADGNLKSGAWSREIGIEVDGKTLGVVGCGNIGRRVATLAIGIGMEVFGFDTVPDHDFQPDGFTWVSLDELLSTSLFITLHSPPAGEPLIDETAIRKIPAGAFLVNTARAALVDTDAILAALDDGRLAGYAVDVHEVEPPVDTRVAEHLGVIATPHIGGFTEESVTRAATLAALNLIRALQEARNG